MTVLMTGCVLVLDRGGLRCFDSIVHSASPTVANLEVLDWGPAPTGAVDVWLTAVLNGELFRPGLHGGLIANRAVWRSYLVRRLRPRLVYERLERRFYTRNETNDWQPVAENAIRAEQDGDTVADDVVLAYHLVLKGGTEKVVEMKSQLVLPLALALENMPQT